MRGILLIVIDCLRADHVSCYGYDRPTTPTIDSLAEQVIVWEQAHSLSSWTKPSVTSLLTGLYPTQHGAFQGIKRSKGRTAVTTDVLRTAGPTLAEALSEAGWRCGAFMNNAQLGEFTRLNRGFSSYAPNAGKADRLIGIFLEWLEADLDRPFFGYLHFLEAHWPYKPRRRHMTLLGGDRDTNCFRDYSARDFGHLRRAISRGERTLSGDELRQMVVMYDAAVRRLDGKLKIITAMLRELNVRDETAIFVTADHGEEFMEHGGIGHGQALHDELTHVPLVGYVPGSAGGVRRPQPVSQVDLPRTMLDLAGVDAPLPGVNLLDFDAKPRPVCSELRIRRHYMQTIRSGHWKLHRRYHFKPEDGEIDDSQTPPEWVASTSHSLERALYDMTSDPGEQVNLADHPAYSAVRDNLSKELDQWWAGLASGGGVKSECEVEISDEVVQRLRDLGYID